MLKAIMKQYVDKVKANHIYWIRHLGIIAGYMLFGYGVLQLGLLMST